MARTRHIHKRMNQRGINSRLVDLVSQFGVEDGDRLVLDRKNTQSLLDAMDSMRKDLLDIHAKGGVVVVEVGDSQLTTFTLNSYERKRAGGKHGIH